MSDLAGVSQPYPGQRRVHEAVYEERLIAVTPKEDCCGSTDSSLNFLERQADLGKGESPWLDSGKRGTLGMMTFELSVPGTTSVAFPMMLPGVNMEEGSDILTACISVEQC
ncbi:hypothetical protein Cadr_000029339 [Camelus dromedarius]|uniref:Uncharacterized protein n=1 Tax=Camelus dromedarius TaxID=9838 RepID=A0A5N4C6A5_CAMDR|nr:hypothetical protein Cadr_000029339 [Camelus dromedarius]